MSVEDIMRPIITVEPKTTATEICRRMRDEKTGVVLIKLDAFKWGIITERDIIKKVVACEKEPLDTKAEEIMVDLSYTIDYKSSIQKASELFNRYSIRRLPVMKNGEVIGIISVRDVAKRLTFKSLKVKLENGRSLSPK